MKKLIIFVVYPVLVFFINILCRMPFLFSLISFYGAPAFYVSTRNRRYIPHAMAVSFAVFPLFVVFDYMGLINKAWYNGDSLWGFRIIDIFTIEELLWALFLNYFIAIVYFSYINNKPVIRSKFIPYFAIFNLLLIGLFFVINNNKELFVIPRFYLVFGLIVVVSPIFFNFYKKIIPIKRFLWLMLYFTFFHFLYEIAGVRLKWWEFQGVDYLGQVSIFGATFPFEELLFWVIMGAPSSFVYLHLAYKSKASSNIV